MSISLTPKTQELIEARMKRGGFANADELVQHALATMEEVESEPIDDETAAAIDRGIDQGSRGEGRAWEQVREELRAKYRV